MYPATNGISCYEGIMRFSCYCFCVRFNDTYKEDPDLDDDDQEKKGFKLFITYVAYSFIFGTRKEQQNLRLKKQKRLRKEKTGIMKKLMVRKEQSEVTKNFYDNLVLCYV